MEEVYPRQETYISSFFQSHMSLITNLIAASIFGLSFLSPVFSKELKSIGLFALSGSLTNWIAVHMLFEKIPGFYGSGVIVVKFKEFKKAIHKLIMTEFFSHDHIKTFFLKENIGEQTIGKEIKNFLSKLNYDALYKQVLEALLKSPVGPMLAMVGGERILEPAKPYFIETMKEKVNELAEEATKDEELKRSIEELFSSDKIKPKIESVIIARLEELTPLRIKEIVESIIKEHLGWLVVWGGVFGGLIGLIASFF